MSRLCLKRRKGDSVRIGPDVVVTVVEVSGASVRLSIEAPGALAVSRGDGAKTEARRMARAQAEPRRVR